MLRYIHMDMVRSDPVLRVLVVTALQVESTAVRRHLRAFRRVQGGAPAMPDLGGRISSWTFAGDQGLVEVGLYEVGRGNVSTAAATTEATSAMKPDVAVFVGVGGALKRAPLGDVVAVDKAINPQWGKEDRKKGLISRTQAENSSPYLVELARTVAGDRAWSRRLQRRRPGARAIVEAAASTDVVVANRRSHTARLIAKVASEAEVVEMEGLGFLHAANRAHCHAIVVRGTSDGQNDKEAMDRAGGQQTAAENAAAFAFELIGQIRPVGLPGRRTPAPDQPGEALVSAAPPMWPQLCQAELEALRDDDPKVAQLVRRAVGDTPRYEDPALRQLLVKTPRWMSDAPAGAWLLLAHLGGAYGFPGLAAVALEAAADAGARRPQSVLASAALYAIDGGDPVAGRRLVDRAAEFGDDPFVEVVDAWLKDNMDAVVEAAQRVADDDDDEVITARSLLAAGRERLGDLGAALHELEALLARYPGKPGLNISPAAFLLQRAQRGGPTRPTDLEKSAQLARSARDNRRVWGGDSAPPAALLVEVLIEAGDLEAALTLATPLAEGGEAVALEAGSPLLIEAGAKAALMTGRTKIAAALARRLPVGPARTGIEGMLAKRAGGPKDTAVAAFWRAYETAENPGQRFANLYHLATLGEDVDVEAQIMREKDEELADRVLAAAESSRSQHVEAIARLRRWENTSVAAAEALSQAHIVADQIDHAVRVLEDAADHQSAPQLLIEAIDLLGLEPNLAEVRRLGAKALERLPHGTAMRRHVIGRLLEVAGREGDWESVVDRAEELRREGDDRDEIRWALVLGHLHLSEFDKAMAAMQGPTLLEPNDEYRAGVQIYLLCQQAPGAETVRRALELCRRFAFSEEVRAMALTSIYTMSPQEPLPAPELADLHAETAAFRTDFANSALMKIVTIPKDDPEIAIAQMEEMVGAPAPPLVELIEKVVAGTMPLGMLASAQRRPYAELLLGGGTGRLFAVDAHLLEVETASADESLDGDILVDLSSLDLACRLPKDWQVHMVGAFRRIRVTDRAVRDALHARDDLRLRSTLKLVRVAPDQPMTLAAISEAEADDLARRSEVLAEFVRSFRQVACRGLGHFPVCDPAVEGSWLGAIEVAADQHCALLCDDVLLRQLARELGIPTFSTMALMCALAARGRVTNSALADYQLEMVRQRVVDLPFDPERLHTVAEESDYQMGPAVIAFGRPIVWSQPRKAMAFITTACDRAAKHGIDGVLPWFIAGLQGAECYPPGAVADFAAALIQAAWRSLRYAPEPLVLIIQLARQAAERSGGTDPLPPVVRQLADALGLAMAEDQVLVNILRLVGRLEEGDRGIVLKSLLDRKGV